MVTRQEGDVLDRAITRRQTEEWLAGEASRDDGSPPCERLRRRFETYALPLLGAAPRSQTVADVEQRRPRNAGSASPGPEACNAGSAYCTRSHGAHERAKRPAAGSVTRRPRVPDRTPAVLLPRPRRRGNPSCAQLLLLPSTQAAGQERRRARSTRDLDAGRWVTAKDHHFWGYGRPGRSESTDASATIIIQPPRLPPPTLPHGSPPSAPSTARRRTTIKCSRPTWAHPADARNSARNSD